MDPKHSHDLHYLWWLALTTATATATALLVWLRYVRARYMPSDLYNS
jgi:hypothetical protein